MSVVEQAAPETLGQRIKSRRQDLGLSVSELARRAGVTRDTLKGWESDAKAPRSNRLMTLAGVLETSIGWLLEGRGDCAPAPDVNPDIAQLRSRLVHARDLAQSLAATLESLQSDIEALESRRDGG